MEGKKVNRMDMGTRTLKRSQKWEEIREDQEQVGGERTPNGSKEYVPTRPYSLLNEAQDPTLSQIPCKTD